MAENPERLLKDKSYTSVQIASEFATQDGTSTPQTSPLAYTAADITTITNSDRGIEIVLRPTSQLRVSEDSTMARYTLIDAGMSTPYPLGRMSALYIQGDSADGTLYFTFNLV